MVRKATRGRWQVIRFLLVSALPLIAATGAIYVFAYLAWKHVGPLHDTDAANQWLSALVTTGLAVAAISGWIYHSRRSHYIQLAELFASIHSEITTREVLGSVEAGWVGLSEVDQQVLRATWLRNSARIDVIKKYEKAAIEFAKVDLDRRRDSDGGSAPFTELFNAVEAALLAIGSLLPDDPEVAAQKARNSRTFGQNHAKNSGVQSLYSGLAAYLAGRPVSPGDVADIVVGTMPYAQVRLSGQQQAVELLDPATPASAVGNVWIAGSGAGELLSAETEHRHRKDSDGKQQLCQLNQAATRRGILSVASASSPVIDGAALGAALVAYLESVEDLPDKISCPHCRALASFNAARARNV